MAYADKTKAFAQRVYEWLSTFGTVYRGVLPAGKETDDLYIQIQGYADKFATEFVFPVHIYKKNTESYISVVNKAEQIGNAVGEGGLLVINNDVIFKVEKGSPFYQDKADEDKTVRAGYINLLITIY